jgi:hypothetical protein
MVLKAALNKMVKYERAFPDTFDFLLLEVVDIL